MIERLANVMYWAGCGCAFLSAALGIVLWFAARASSSDRWFLLGCGVAAALAAWLIGRACRYVLAGR